jgi:hypothetical protein
MILKNLDTKSFLFKDVVIGVRSKMETQNMINEIIDTTKADANDKVIADMDMAQASFMKARAEMRKAEEMKGRPN